MIDMKIAKQGLINSGLAVLYIVLIATVMNNAEKLFGPDTEKSLAGPIVFLLLFVVSAAVMGSLIFGKPVMMYIDGKKREAVALIACTIGSLAAITALVLLAVGYGII